jgi:uncharacterized damage-inducible protein DinB
MVDPRYPIGPFGFSGQANAESRARCIAEIAAAPGHLRAAVSELNPAQLDTRYREGGWSVRQVIHHVPDSHLNAYTRFKLALTEDEPTIKPYEEARWAELPDVRSTPVETSLMLLECLHRRWVLLLRAMTPADFARKFRHPEHGRLVPLDEVLEMYAWHGQHHVAQITSLRTRMGWT